jgi:hypothetical protein
MEKLQVIAKELRNFAENAHGNPAKVFVRKKTLLQWAEALEEVYHTERGLENERSHNR